MTISKRLQSMSQKIEYDIDNDNETDLEKLIADYRIPADSQESQIYRSFLKGYSEIYKESIELPEVCYYIEQRYALYGIIGAFAGYFLDHIYLSIGFAATFAFVSSLDEYLRNEKIKDKFDLNSISAANLFEATLQNLEFLEHIGYEKT